MVKKFKPPALKDLAAVDVADVRYSSEIIEIVGVVSHAGQGGWPHCKDYDVHCFGFAAWRHVGGELINRSLTVLRPVRSAGDSFSDFDKGTIHLLQVILSEDETRAVFAKEIKANHVDAELGEIADQLNMPVIVHTDRFGPLTLNRRINVFEGEAEWNGEIVSLHFEPDDNLDLKNQLQTAETLFADSIRWGGKSNGLRCKKNLN